MDRKKEKSPTKREGDFARVWREVSANQSLYIQIYVCMQGYSSKFGSRARACGRACERRNREEKPMYVSIYVYALCAPMATVKFSAVVQEMVEREEREGASDGDDDDDDDDDDAHP